MCRGDIGAYMSTATEYGSDFNVNQHLELTGDIFVIYKISKDPLLT